MRVCDKIKKIAKDIGDYMSTHIEVIIGDITELDVDAVVNSANKSLQKGSGICKCVYEKAGEELAAALEGHDELEAGQAILTSGFNLQAEYIIHIVTPKYLPPRPNNKYLLSQCYVSILDLAVLHNLKSLAIPCLGAGHHMWPIKLSAQIAIDTILWNFARLISVEKLYLVCLTKEQYEVYSRYLLGKNGVNSNACGTAKENVDNQHFGHPA